MLLNVGSGKKRSHLIMKLYQSRQIAQVPALCVRVRCTHIRWMPKLLWGVAIPSNQTLFSMKKNPPLFFLLLDLLVPELVSMEEFKGTAFQSFHKFLSN